MLRIATMDGHERMATQELLEKIALALANGETDFHISASGQHDIGGPCWNEKGLPLHFTVTNPGQRVGAMCLPDTEIIVEGSAPADVGWLNSGGIITVKGDAGDTAGHCAAAGKIYIGGRTGTRSGSLMKRDPLSPPPELWILESTGSFSFEFMGGGTAVVCGHNSQTLPSVLGERPCVGMVAGVVYFRGPCGELPQDVMAAELSQEDIAWLDSGLEVFLEAIGQKNLRKELSIWRHWRKITPTLERTQERLSLRDFRVSSWYEKGLFGDILQDEGEVAPLVGTGALRLRVPLWHREKCSDCRQCLVFCPNATIKRREQEGQTTTYSTGAARCTGCGICAAICPGGAWEMRDDGCDW